jgi:lysozyme family protein
MSSDFQRALAFMLKAEAGYTNHPADRGGPTNKGILQREYDQYRRAEGLPPADVRDILNAKMEDIYLHNYWLAGRYDRMPWSVSLAHFDACVNVGVAQAVKFLQRTVGTRDDGVVGPLTLGALTAALKRESPRVLAVRLARQRIPLYRELAKRDPQQRVFLSGWLNRVEAILIHRKSEHRLERNRLKGTLGNAINALLSAAAMNFGKLIKWVGQFWLLAPC